MSIYEGFDPSQVPEPFGNRHDPKHTDTSRSGDLVQNLRDMPVWPMEEAADRIEELEAALKRIADFGTNNPGHGRSCAVIALRALVGDERD